MLAAPKCIGSLFGFTYPDWIQKLVVKIVIFRIQVCPLSTRSHSVGLGWPVVPPRRCSHLGVEPKIGGFYPPKWMVKIMENPIKMDDLGGPPLFLENTHFSLNSIWSDTWSMVVYKRSYYVLFPKKWLDFWWHFGFTVYTSLSFSMTKMVDELSPSPVGISTG